ncbi:MAG: hybrid sensor histidine kinase/response regulator [Desulfamplus sp.]|nr:hybrid sensor histidine kinase/response regulator [Desulfamplus sp.]
MRRKILIVDDTEVSIDVLVDALDGLYEIMVATSGKEAIEIALQTTPDLILLDIIMPEIDGYETCRQLKSNPSTADIPIIFVTAMSDIEDETKGLELGAIDYITKPLSIPIVRARVKNHIELRLAHKCLKSQAKQLEKQNKELIEIGRLREDIENITRHDLKTPLNGIINFPELIKFQGGLNEAQTEYLEHIVACGYKMLNMINLSLDLFKMEKGVYTFTPGSVDILIIINNILNELEKHIKFKKLSISFNVNDSHSYFAIIEGIKSVKDRVEIGKQITFLVKGEHLLCYSMLSNLMQNAIEASPELGRIDIILSTAGDKAIISINNQGAVPADIRERFFNKYVTSGKRKGTGLGAYSAKLIAQTQKGEIKMKTSDEEGTSIIIYLNR